MGPVVVDIETAGLLDDLPEPVQQYLIERAERFRPQDEDAFDPVREVEDSLPLNPAAGRIVAIGLWAPLRDAGAVLINNEGSDRPDSSGFEKYDERTAVFFGSEKAILTAFWQKLEERAGSANRRPRYPVVTFNGRAFDGPFLMLRSAIHGVKPSRNLVGYRYSFQDHCDLQEVFTFMGALPRAHRYSLEFWCHQFGIPSPKETMDGSQVGLLWRQGDFDALIRYSLGDVQATAALYLKVQPLIEVLQPQ